MTTLLQLLTHSVWQQNSVAGDDLLKEDVDEEDVESLLIQQIEFCSTIILNKVDKVTEEQLKRVKAMIKTLSQKAQNLLNRSSARLKLKDILEYKVL